MAFGLALAAAVALADAADSALKPALTFYASFDHGTDADLAKGGDHVNFSLSSLGEPIALYSRTKSLLDKRLISKTIPGESEGRLPDGATRITKFPSTPTPGKSNYLPV